MRAIIFIKKNYANKKHIGYGLTGRLFIKISLFIIALSVCIVISFCTWRFFKVNYASSVVFKLNSSTTGLKIALFGSLEEAHRVQIELFLKPYLKEDFFTLDLDKMDKGLHEFPWLKNLKVSKTWPQTLTLEVEEHQPLAYWYKGYLITATHEVIATVDDMYNIPTILGPKEQVEKLVSLFGSINERLKLLSLKIEKLEVTKYGSVLVTLDNNLLLLLGRDDVLLRMDRLVRLYNKVLRENLNNISYVDLRYTNAMAVGKKTD